ncbi:MAG: hypothetical protein WBP40_04100 [Candidatus Moraniibacteriota bacterium]
MGWNLISGQMSLDDFQICFQQLLLSLFVDTVPLLVESFATKQVA